MIIDEIKKSNMEALKSHDESKRTAYSLVMNKYMLAKIEKKAKGEEISDTDMVAILQKAIKELDEEQSIYEKANRTETVEDIKCQKEALQIFLPQMMSEEEIRTIILSLEDKSIGAVMKHFKQNYAGKCEMKTVQEVLKNI